MQTIPIAPIRSQKPAQATASEPEGVAGFETTLYKAINSPEKASQDQPGASPSRADQTSADNPAARASELPSQAINDGNLLTQSAGSRATPEAASTDLSWRDTIASTTVTTPLNIPVGSGSLKVSGALTSAGLTLYPDASGTAGAEYPLLDTLQGEYRNNSRSQEILKSPQLSITLETIAKYPAAAHTTTQQAMSQENVLLNQIQSLIGSPQDTVQLNINLQTSANGLLPGYLNTPVIIEGKSNGQDLSITLSGRQVSGSAGLTSEVVAQQKGDTNLQTLRHDAQGQYLQAKVANLENNPDSQAESNPNNQNTASQQGSTTTTSPTGQPVSGQHTSQGNTEQTSLNQGFAGHLNELTALNGTQSAKPIHLPSGQVITSLQQQEAINQIVNRLSLTSRLQTSRIRMQLHPAQLGELKIDVLVRGDSLKANIFAQTQQAQDLIEKNLPRLRAVLHDNGLKVEDLFVTLESDNLDDFTKQQNNQFHDTLDNFQANDLNARTEPGGGSFSVVEASETEPAVADQTARLSVTA